MKKGILKFLLVACGLVYAGFASAQCDTIATVCAKHLQTGFISDGQQYRALLLNSTETAEFHATFYGGLTYRIAACSGLTDGNLIFSVYDSQHNLLFTNKDYSNAAYWDFKITSTIDCTIDAHLDSQTNQGSGCAVILIGFKQ